MMNKSNIGNNDRDKVGTLATGGSNTTPANNNNDVSMVMDRYSSTQLILNSDLSNEIISSSYSRDSSLNDNLKDGRVSSTAEVAPVVSNAALSGVSSAGAGSKAAIGPASSSSNAQMQRKKYKKHNTFDEFELDSKRELMWNSMGTGSEEFNSASNLPNGGSHGNVSSNPRAKLLERQYTLNSSNVSNNSSNVNNHTNANVNGAGNSVNNNNGKVGNNYGARVKSNNSITTGKKQPGNRNGRGPIKQTMMNKEASNSNSNVKNGAGMFDATILLNDGDDEFNEDDDVDSDVDGVGALVGGNRNAKKALKRDEAVAAAAILMNDATTRGGPSTTYQAAQMADSLSTLSDKKKKIIVRIVTVFSIIFFLICFAMIAFTLRMSEKIDAQIRKGYSGSNFNAFTASTRLNNQILNTMQTRDFKNDTVLSSSIIITSDLANTNNPNPSNEKAKSNSTLLAQSVNKNNPLVNKSRMKRRVFNYQSKSNELPINSRLAIRQNPSPLSIFLTNKQHP